MVEQELIKILMTYKTITNKELDELREEIRQGPHECGCPTCRGYKE